MVAKFLADWRGQHVRLKLGIRWIPKLDATNGPPDLEVMKERDPERYNAFWRGTVGARTGKGCLGRQLADDTLHTCAKDIAGRAGTIVRRI